jgi:hypothetical protein
MARFPANEIISLIRETFRYHFGESVGRDLRLGDVLGACAQRKLGDSVRRFEAFRFRSMTATGSTPPILVQNKCLVGQSVCNRTGSYPTGDGGVT